MSPDPLYDVVFDAALQPFPWGWPALGLLVVTLGVLLRRSELRLIAKNPKQKTSLSSRFFLGFSILWALAAGVGALSYYAAPRRAGERGSHRTAEGVVENFDPMPFEGHKPESFTVRGQTFAYSDYDITPYFHQSASHGGPIRADMRVRILHIDGKILRIEVERGFAPAAVADRRKGGLPGIGVVIALVTALPLLTALISFLGGWRGLSERYPAPEQAEGETFFSESLSLGLFGSYNNCIHVTVGPAGIRLVPMLFFRLFHEPILIPWGNVQDCQRSTSFFARGIIIKVGASVDQKSLRISGRSVAAIESIWQKRQGRASPVNRSESS
jgi:hypothetical protein